MINFWNIRRTPSPIENIGINTSKFIQGSLIGIDFYGFFLQKVNRSKFIHPKNMVDMMVGKQNGIYGPDIPFQCLCPKVNTGIDDDVFSGILNPQRSP
jgi:hypothetical protein